VGIYVLDRNGVPDSRMGLEAVLEAV
jgi:hypothetical protein